MAFAGEEREVISIIRLWFYRRHPLLKHDLSARLLALHCAHAERPTRRIMW